MIMKGQIVEQSDLICAIKDFPIEVVQEMVNEQVRQGNMADVEAVRGKNSRDGLFQRLAYDAVRHP